MELKIKTYISREGYIPGEKCKENPFHETDVGTLTIKDELIEKYCKNIKVQKDIALAVYKTILEYFSNIPEGN